MKPSEIGGGAVGSLRPATPAARADGAERDGSPRIDLEQIVSLEHLDGADVDNVEHERQNRLKRWQKPPIPTRKASH